VDHGEPGVDPTESGEEAIGHSLKKTTKNGCCWEIWGGGFFGAFRLMYD
jgi:hypothetical protein